jgi:hypothetical protein
MTSKAKSIPNLGCLPMSGADLEGTGGVRYRVVHNAGVLLTNERQCLRMVVPSGGGMRHPRECAEPVERIGWHRWRNGTWVKVWSCDGHADDLVGARRIMRSTEQGTCAPWPRAMRTLIVIRLIFSAAGELFGTVTVAINYSRCGQLARAIVEAFSNDFDTRDNTVGIPRQIKSIALQFETRPILSAGLVVYVAGAELGLTAGLLAIYA